VQYQRWLAPVLLLLVLLPADAQSGRGSGRSGLSTGSVHIHVTFADDRRASINLQVQLMQGSSSTPVRTTFTNSNGEASFWGIPVGDYHVVVSGEGIQLTESAVFEVDSRQVTQSQYVSVRSVDAASSGPGKASPAPVSAADLNAPPKARKEFEKANEAIAGHEWSKAVELFKKAISIYPQYVSAYNNLAVSYAKMNDVVHEQQALEKAVGLDDHYAPACHNLAKVYLQERDFPRAEDLLQKALSADPNNGENLALLADTQYMERRYDAAIATAQKVHTLPSHPPVAHYIAAMAYEQQNNNGQALAEFQTFLKEEPTGPRADRVRSDLGKLQRATENVAANSQ